MDLAGRFLLFFVNVFNSQFDDETRSDSLLSFRYVDDILRTMRKGGHPICFVLSTQCNRI